MNNYNTIAELEKQGRYAEAGYGRLFAHNQNRINAMIDARTKAKFMREKNPETTDELQLKLFYSGPSTFVNKKIHLEKNLKIVKMDLKSAYLGYLINEKIKKPGVFRIRRYTKYPISDRIQLYVLKFNCEADNPFVNWYLNQAAIQKKKVFNTGNRIYGKIAVFASTWMNQLKMIGKFLKDEEVECIDTYSYYGKKAVPVKMSQIRRLYQMKELGVAEAKMQLVQSTGWLSIIDKSTYYHMVQYIKFYLMETAMKYGFFNDIVGNQTDCILYHLNERTKNVIDEIENDNLSLGQQRSSIGKYTYQVVDYSDLKINDARIVLKHA